MNSGSAPTKPFRPRMAFIVGSGRSGSTLLYNILSMHPRIGYISNMGARLPRWFPSDLLQRWLAPFPGMKKWSWFGSGGNAYVLSRDWLKRLVPAPVEGEPVYRSCGVPLFPRKGEILTRETRKRLSSAFLRMAERQGCSVFLSKRTANCRRILWLHETFPQARFIHLIRDGRAASYSLSRVAWWSDESRVWWEEKSLGELRQEGWSRLAISARAWVEDVRLVRQSLEQIPADMSMEVRYETLLEHPAAELERILAFLELGMTDSFRRALDALALSPRPPAWRKAWDDEQLETVMEQQRELLQLLGYE